MQTPRIMIIGAGLGGLALAQGLSRAGFDVVVFERDQSPESRAQGYRISIRAMGLAALKALLPKDKFERLDYAKVADVGDGFIYATSQMKPLLKILMGKDAAIQLLRAELRNILLEGINIQWNKRLVALEESSDKVTIHFEDGLSASGDLLVGCDGGASKVRELMKSHGARSLPKVLETGLVTFGGQIDRTPEWNDLLVLNRDGFVRYLGPHGHSIGVCFSERKDRSPTVFWALSEEMGEREPSWYQLGAENTNRQRILERCKELINKKGWHLNLQKLINQTNPNELREPWFLPTTHFSKDNQFPMMPSGRITLLGDAAHSMPPDRGLGGNNVLEDARLLVSILGAPQKDIVWPKVIAEYETQMLARAKRAVEESTKAAKMHIIKNPVSIIMRNTILKIMGLVMAWKNRG
jgi:salicylate hydroxylase